MIDDRPRSPGTNGTPGPARARERGAEGLAADLSREFGAPVGLLDPSGPTWRAQIGVPADAFPAAEVVPSEAPFDRERARVVSPEGGEGPSWLVLPIPGLGGEFVHALVGFATSHDPSGPTPWGPPCPAPALRAWGQEVADRLRSEAEADAFGRIGSPRTPGTDESAVLGRLLRRLRVSDAPEQFQRVATMSLREATGARAVAWVPGHPDEPTIVDGPLDRLAPADLRALATGPAPPRSVLVAADGSVGWLVLLGLPEGRPPDPALAERLRPVASLIVAQRANARLYAELKELLVGVIRALTAAIDAKDPYTSGHSERVARIAVRIGEELGMAAARRGDLYLMGLLHDVGKIGVEDGVLKKPGPLNAEEFRQIQAHVRIGVLILADLKKLQHLIVGVEHHHERVDGRGYPDGLIGEAIPLEARILAVADAFDAMSSTRPYRKRLEPDQIDRIFREGAGTSWDPRLVDTLFACRADLERIHRKGLGQSLRLAVDGTLGRT